LSAVRLNVFVVPDADVWNSLVGGGGAIERIVIVCLPFPDFPALYVAV
jgi:hypothetical protein